MFTTRTRTPSRTPVFALCSGAALIAASLVGAAQAANADYVSPDDLDSGATGFAYSSGEPADFTRCSIVIPQAGGFVGQFFDPADTQPLPGNGEVLMRSAFVKVVEGEGELLVNLRGGSLGEQGIVLHAPVGVTGFGQDNPDVTFISSVGNTEQVTFEEALDQLESSAYIESIGFSAQGSAEVQWISTGSFNYWFGTDAEWYLDDPECQGVEAPTVPDRVETAARG